MKTREELDNAGRQILGNVRTELYLSMHFMGEALGSLGLKMDLSTRTVGTDAVSIRFNPTYLIHNYIERPELLNRIYMHILMHCLFRHMFSAKEHEDIELWDLSCDIAAESVVDSMDYPTILRVSSQLREEWYDLLTSELKVLTAEKIYHFFMLRKRDPYLEESLRQEFSLCDHSFWERMQEEPDDIKPDAQQSAADQTGKSDSPTSAAGPAEDKWRDRAKRIEDELELSSKEAAEDAGSLAFMLHIKNRRRRSYKDFLQRFAILREEVGIDMDSFDYGFYMHGLSLYGNMPLIEENEYREAKKVEELVIAIDTSASCKERLVQQFLTETAAILSAQENFFKKVNIRLIECDNRIQNETVFTDIKDMEKYAGLFTAHGGYGTDFVPVFARIEELQKAGELKNLKGLMYFTDGYGEFPKKSTGYDTVFVFYGGDDFDDSKVPDWAVKLYFDEEESINNEHQPGKK